MKIGSDLPDYLDLLDPGLPHYSTFVNTPIDSAAFKNRVRLLWFLDNGSCNTWLAEMETILNEMSTFLVTNGIASDAGDVANHFRPVAVIANHGGDPLVSDSYSFPILLDANNTAIAYRGEFLATNDDCFTHANLSTVGNEMWGFIIFKDFILTDKWHDQCTVPAQDDPISFHYLTTSFLNFESTVPANTAAFTLERLKNLFRTLTVLSTDPQDGVSVDSAAIAALKIRFSRPVNGTAVITTNYGFGGGGGGGLGIDSISYGNAGLNIGEIENEATLSVSKTPPGSLDPGTVVLNLTSASIIDSEGGPLETNNGSYYSITYNGPRVLNISPDPAVVINTVGFSNPFLITVTYTDEMCKDGAPTVPLNPDDFSLSGTGDYASLADADLSFAPPTATVSAIYRLSIKLTGLSGSGTFRVDFGALQTDIYGNSLLGSNSTEYTLDTTGPTITSAALAPNNNSIALQFSEPVYTNPDGTGAVGLNDFTFTFNQNGGTATINPLTGFSVTHIPGDASLSVGLTITNVPCGVEQVTIEPKTNEIYDSAGNPLIAVSALEFTLNDTRSPADLVLVLDYSGSMDSEVTFDGTERTKKGWVKYTVDYFLNLMDDSDYVDDQDEIGMVLYASNAIDARSLQLFQDVADRNSYLAGLEGAPVADLTAMGSGLARALTMVNYSQSNNAYSRKRSIILLADGQQNRGPEIEITGTGYRILAPGGGPPDTNWPPIGDIVVNRGDPAFFPIHTIGIGYHSSWLTRLQNIAGATNGIHHADNEVWDNLAASFSTFLTALYPNNSPQLVRNNTESFTPGESNDQGFELNSTVNQLIIGVTWAAPHPLKFTLQKGSTRIVFDKVIENEESQFYIGVVSFPHCQHQQPMLHLHGYGKRAVREGRFESRASVVRSDLMFHIDGSYIPAERVKAEDKDCINPEGSWKVSIYLKNPEQSPSQTISYHLTIIADEKKFAFQVVNPGLFLWTGDKIDLWYWLTADGKIADIPHRTQIQISSPSIGSGKLLSRLPVDNPVLHIKAAADARTSPVLLKLELIQKLRKTMAALQRKRKKTLLLSSAIIKGSKEKVTTTGVRGAVFAGTRTPGAYRVDYKIRSEGKQGIYERVHSEHYFINVKPDRGRTKIRAQYNRKYQSYIVTVTPKDRFRNYLGPGYKDQIQCILVDKKNRVQISDIIDNLNGSYQVGFKEISKAELKSKNLHIRVMKRYVFNDKLSKIRKICFLSRLSKALCNRICHRMK